MTDRRESNGYVINSLDLANSQQYLQGMFRSVYGHTLICVLCYSCVSVCLFGFLQKNDLLGGDF